MTGTRKKEAWLDARGTWQGLIMMTPVAVFTVAFGLAFGVAAVHHGLVNWEAMLLSVVVFSAPSQFAALEMWRTPMPLIALATITLAIHTRHVLMSAALYPWLQSLSRRRQFAMVLLMSDSNWAMALGEYHRGERNLGILLGGGIALWGAWVLGTLVGVLFGGVITEPERYGLDVIMLCFFLMMVLGGRPRMVMTMPWLAAALAALAAYRWLPPYLHVMVGGLTGGIVAVLMPKHWFGASAS